MTQSELISCPNRIELKTTLRFSEDYPTSAYFVFDFDFMKIFGTSGKVPVVLTVGEHTFRSTIAVYSGVHMMVFNREMRFKTGFKAGDTINIVLERDCAKRQVEISEDVMQALKEKGCWEAFATYSYSHQKEVMDWINEAKKPETRQRRICKLIEKMTTNP